MRRGRAAGLALALASALWPGAAAASPAVHGAIDARPLLGFSERYGGALGADVWWGSGILRAGVGFAVGALSSNAKASSRVFTPVGASLDLSVLAAASSPFATLRVGALPGAEKGGLYVGGWGSCALGYRLSLGEGASVRLGADAWYLMGPRGGFFVGPFVGLGF